MPVSLVKMRIRAGERSGCQELPSLSQSFRRISWGNANGGLEAHLREAQLKVRVLLMMQIKKEAEPSP